MKPILRESELWYQRIVLVCEVQPDWNHWILQHREAYVSFCSMQHVDEAFAGLHFNDVLRLLPLGWSSQWEVNPMAKSMIGSAVSLNKLVFEPGWTVGFLRFSDDVQLIMYLESGRYWSCSLGCLLRAEFAPGERQEGKRVLCPTALGRLVYCLWTWGCFQ